MPRSSLRLKRVSALASTNILKLNQKLDESQSAVVPPIELSLPEDVITEDMVKYVMAAAKVLKPEYRETAFTWAAIILISDGVLTEARKNILDRYAMLLNIDMKVAQKILVQVSQQIPLRPEYPGRKGR